MQLWIFSWGVLGFDLGCDEAKLASKFGMELWFVCWGIPEFALGCDEAELESMFGMEKWIFSQVYEDFHSVVMKPN